MKSPFQIFIFLIILFFLSCRNELSSQSKILYFDDFDDNRNLWTNSEHENGYFRIDSSFYRISLTQTEGNSYVYTKFNINTSEDFAFEAQMIDLGGGPNRGFGLVMTEDDESISYHFVAYQNSTFSVYKLQNGKPTMIKTNQKIKGIRDEYRLNILKLVRNGKEVSFYINENKAFSGNFSLKKPDNLGFVVHDVIKLDIDKIILYQDNPPINIIPDMKYGAKKINLGPNINTKFNELNPVITSNGKTLFFVRENETKDQDIFYSEVQPDGTWALAKNIGPQLNNDKPNAVTSVTTDGNTLLLNFFKVDKQEKQGGFFITRKTEDGWGELEKSFIKNYYSRTDAEASCLAPDGKTMILSLERDDGFGQEDLYVSFMLQHSLWSEPMNLGPDINTGGKELTPFMAADGKSLYFSTDGLPGFGGGDIFMSRRLDSTWKHWSKPQNLGSDINTRGWDAYFSMAASGQYMYLVSSDNSYGENDIFMITLPDSGKPLPLVLISGRVINAKTKKPIASEIFYEILPSGKEAGEAHSDPVTGFYSVTLPSGEVYGLRAEAKGFMSVNENFDLRGYRIYTEIKRDLELMPIEKGAIVPANNIFFNFGKSTLKDESFPELNRLAKVLTDNPTMEIEVDGHTDNVGTRERNMKLSLDRAKAVVDYLNAKGNFGRRIQYQGYGPDKPVATNDTDEGRSKNRRVEFKILKE